MDQAHSDTRHWTYGHDRLIDEKIQRDEADSMSWLCQNRQVERLSIKHHRKIRLSHDTNEGVQDGIS